VRGGDDDSAPAKTTTRSKKNSMDSATMPLTVNDTTASASSSLPLGSAEISIDRDNALLRDIELLSNILSEVVNHETNASSSSIDSYGSVIHHVYEQFRQAGIERSKKLISNNDQPHELDAMIKAAADLQPSVALGVMKVFSM
jgi:hypothetical protein